MEALATCRPKATIDMHSISKYVAASSVNRNESEHTKEECDLSNHPMALSIDGDTPQDGASRTQDNANIDGT